MGLFIVCLCLLSAQFPSLIFKFKSTDLQIFGYICFQNLELLAAINVLQYVYDMYFILSVTKSLKSHNYLWNKIYDYTHTVDKWYINFSQFLSFNEFDVYCLKFSFQISLVVIIVVLIIWSCGELIKYISNVVWCKESSNETIMHLHIWYFCTSVKQY